MSEMREYTFDECVIGLKESFQVEIKEKMLEAFKAISGDINPLHNDADFAKEQGFEKGRVTYGMLTASFLSTIAGVYLPGKYCLIQEVDIKFAKPVFIGDHLEISAEVVERNELFKQLTLKVMIKNLDEGTKVLRGKMKVGVLV